MSKKDLLMFVSGMLVFGTFERIWPKLGGAAGALIIIAGLVIVLLMPDP